jgi:hypothetical protein
MVGSFFIYRNIDHLVDTALLLLYLMPPLGEDD